MIHFLIFKGWGILVPAIVVGSFFLSFVIYDIGPYFPHPDDAFTFISGCWAVLFWIVGNHVNRESGGFNTARVDLKLRSRHSFFFIPIQWWGLFFFCITLLLAFGGKKAA